MAGLDYESQSGWLLHLPSPPPHGLAVWLSAAALEGHALIIAQVRALGVSYGCSINIVLLSTVAFIDGALSRSVEGKTLPTTEAPMYLYCSRVSIQYQQHLPLSS